MLKVTRAVLYTCTKCCIMYTKSRLFKNEEKIDMFNGNKKLKRCAGRSQKTPEFNPRKKRSTQFRSRPTKKGKKRRTRRRRRRRSKRPRRRRRKFVDFRRHWIPKRKIFKYKKRFSAPLIPSKDRYFWNAAKSRLRKRRQNRISYLQVKQKATRYRILRRRRLKKNSKKHSFSMQKCFWTLRPTHIRLFAKSFEELGRITPVRMNFLNSKHQRYAASLVKRARLSGLLPFMLYRRTFGHRFRFFNYRNKYFGWVPKAQRKVRWFYQNHHRKRKNDLRDTSRRVRKSLRGSMSMIFLPLKYSAQQINNFFYLLKIKGGLTKKSYYLFFKNMKKNINNLARSFPRSFFSLQTQAFKLQKICSKLWIKGQWWTPWYSVDNLFPNRILTPNRLKVWRTTNNSLVIGLRRGRSFNFMNMSCKTLMLQVFRRILLEKRAYLYQLYYSIMLGQKTWRQIGYIKLPPPPSRGEPLAEVRVDRESTEKQMKKAKMAASRKTLAVPEFNWWKNPCIGKTLWRRRRTRKSKKQRNQNRRTQPRRGRKKRRTQRGKAQKRGLTRWPNYVLAPQHRRKALCKKRINKILKKKQKIIVSMLNFVYFFSGEKSFVRYQKLSIIEILKRLAEVAKSNNLVKGRMESINCFQGSITRRVRERFGLFWWRPHNHNLYSRQKNLVKELLISSRYFVPETKKFLKMKLRRWLRFYGFTLIGKFITRLKLQIWFPTVIRKHARRFYHNRRENLYIQARVVEKLYGKSVEKVKTITLKFRLLQHWAKILRVVGKRFAHENYLVRKIDERVR